MNYIAAFDCPSNRAPSSTPPRKPKRRDPTCPASPCAASPSESLMYQTTSRPTCFRQKRLGQALGVQRQMSSSHDNATHVHCWLSLTAISAAARKVRCRLSRRLGTLGIVTAPSDPSCHWRAQPASRRFSFSLKSSEKKFFGKQSVVYFRQKLLPPEGDLVIGQSRGLEQSPSLSAQRYFWNKCSDVSVTSGEPSISQWILDSSALQVGVVLEGRIASKCRRQHGGCSKPVYA